MGCLVILALLSSAASDSFKIKTGGFWWHGSAAADSHQVRLYSSSVTIRVKLLRVPPTPKVLHLIGVLCPFFEDTDFYGLVVLELIPSILLCPIPF